MKVIWKWALPIQDVVVIDMPVDAQPLTVQVQNGGPQLWAMVDPDVEWGSRTLRIYGTGHPIHEAPGQYIGTFQFANGALVFHVFDVTDTEASP